MMLRKPLYLPWPLIDDARQESGEEPYRGTVHPRDVRFGAKVRIPADAETAGAQVTVHWEGVSSTGSAIVKDHVPGDPSSYHIPLEAVPANMGHAERVKVYYSATPTNEATQYSPPFELYVEDYPQSSWPQLHCEGISNGQIVLKDVPPEGSPCALDAWSFMAAGQRVRIRARGLNQPGKPDSTWLRDDVPVSEDEYYAEKVKAVLPRTFLEGLQVNHEVLLSVEVSFDDGLSYKTFRTVSARLVP
ncbi:MAG TPA: hypothetical protein DGQ94_20290 [Pseudomonas sp.]|nr:hypothetical protein [Pseudomonas sp.]